MRLSALVLAAVVALPTAACLDSKTAEQAIVALENRPPTPDSMPKMLNVELPFRYPPALYEQKVQGNVDLRLYVDRYGNVINDSTRVARSSGYVGLDSAAVVGARELRFLPAKLNGAAIQTPVLFPVYFRHPEAKPLPGDTVLQRGTTGPAPKTP